MGIRRIQESKFTWLNSNMTDIQLGPKESKENWTLPTNAIIPVEGGGQTRHVALLGLLTEDPALYRPGSFGGAQISLVLDTADTMQQKLYTDDGVDLVLPMTHQVIARDRTFAEHFKGKGPWSTNVNENAFPLVIAAHDHEPYLEDVAGSRIIKVGSDASNIALCDVVWPDANSKAVQISTEMVPSDKYQADPAVQALVDQHKKVLNDLDQAPLFLCDAGQTGYTSKNNRLGPTNLSTTLVSSLRDAMGAECCVLNAGNIRGNKDYDPNKKFFSYSDLKTEIPFDAEMVVLPIPGKVLADAVAFSRAQSFQDPPKSSGGFMQICDACTFDDNSQRLTHVAGQPLDEERVYLTGILFMVCTGVDNIAPLMEWVKANPSLFPIDMAAEMGRPAKLLLVDYFSKSTWGHLGSFEALDASGKGVIDRDDLMREASRYFQSDSLVDLCVNNLIMAADSNGDGTVSREELLRVRLSDAKSRRAIDVDHSDTLERSEVDSLASQVIGSEHGAPLVEKLFNEIDQDGSGAITQLEVQLWLAKNFHLDGVVVPGQSLERKEIDAVKTNLAKNVGSE